MLKIFYSHMMDDAHLSEVEQDLEKLKSSLSGHNYIVVNQDYMLRQYDKEGKIIQIDETEIVKNDLELLKKSNLHIIDFNFQPYFYVGCICELVYSHLYNIPSILIVPDKSYIKRPWLNFHSDIIVTEYGDIPKAISSLKIKEV